MPLALRPALRACAATSLAAALAATAVLPATASPVVPPAPPSAPVSVTDGSGQQASEVEGEQQQTIAVTGIDPEALQPEPDAKPSPVPSAEPRADQSAGPNADENTAPESGPPTPQAAAPRAATVSLASVVSLASAGQAAATPRQQVVPVPEEIAAKATAQTDAETAPEARELAGTALPAEDTEKVAALTSPAETIDFVVAGVTWDVQAAGQVTEVSVRVREGGDWTDWSSLEVHDGDERPGADRTGTEPLVTSGADAVQARVSTVDGRVPQGLQVDIINPGVAATDGKLNPGSPAPAENAQAEEPTAAQASAASAGTSAFVPAVHRQQGLITGTAAAQTVANNADVLKPAIVTRAQWGANESVVSDFGRPATKLKAMYIHHTAGSNTYTQAQAYGQVRGIFTYHAVNLKWGDIGYQFLVDKFGTIYQGRRGSIDAPVQGAQAGGFNTDTIGVSAMGNYDTVAAPAAMVSAIERVLSWQAYRYDVNPVGTTRLTQSGKGTARWTSGTTVTVPTILGHKVTNLTACPGRYLDAKIPGIRKNVEAKVKQAARNNGQTTTPTPAPAGPGTPANPYRLVSPGLQARAYWNPVAGASHYQVMYRAVPQGGGSVSAQAWTAGKTTTGTTMLLTNLPGETAQYAVRAVRNGVPGPQTYLGQHTGPLDWGHGDIYTANMTAVPTGNGINGRGIRYNGAGAALRIENAQQADRLVVTAEVASGTASFRVERDGKYAGLMKIRSGGPTVCAVPLAAGSNVRLELQNNASATLTSAALTRAGHTQDLNLTGSRCEASFADVPSSVLEFTAIDWMQRAGITTGYSDNTFRKNRRISRGESVAFVHRYVDPRHSPRAGRPFRDVSEQHSFYRAISWAKDSKIAMGYADGSFGVGEDVTRGEFASFLYRSAKPRFTVPRTKAFNDVSTGSAHHAAIAWMKKEGLSAGYEDGTFRAERPISRGEVAQILYRYDRNR